MEGTMKKALLVLAVAVLVATLAGPAMAAKDMKGYWGPGYWTTSAPVGIRYWLAPKIGADFGLGFASHPHLTPGDKTKIEFTVDAGVPIVLAGGESTLFFFRPGISYNSYPVNANDNSTTFSVRGSLGVEYFLTDVFSVQAAHGIAFSSYDPGTAGSSSTSMFGTEGFGITTLGFHYYLNK
jgi:hypothetical protein